MKYVRTIISDFETFSIIVNFS